MPETSTRNLKLALLLLLPLFAGLVSWLSPLSFAPVPWPDDSAFYFAAHELFKWPPRWVMLAQAPFEPSYEIFNFNTMPLYPVLIGIGQWVGINGSQGLKFWPLLFWALSGALLGVTLFRKRLSWSLALLVTALIAFDPILRWASVLVRPESFIGLLGVVLILGISFGFPRSLRPRAFFDPIALLLALAAYAHFNAIHLVLPVTAAIVMRERSPFPTLIKIGSKTLLYLSPWLLTVLFQLPLFIHQMTVQWTRLSGGNGWLRAPVHAIGSLIRDIGNPEPWPAILRWGSAGIWLLIFTALVTGFIQPLYRRIMSHGSAFSPASPTQTALAASGAWVVSSCWLWDSKPEVWFIYYIHLAVLTFAGILLLQPKTRMRPILVSLLIAIFGIFAITNVTEAVHLGKAQSWNWKTYASYVDCIDRWLVKTETELGNPKPFRVWAPTPPDVLIELSIRHPDWELTRTNDFVERYERGLNYARLADAVVITETIHWEDRDADGLLTNYPGVESHWLHAPDYFLNRLAADPSWKPDHRYLCQKARWQAFLYRR